MMWNAFFEAGGWGMFPTLLFGFLVVASAVLYVLRPERKNVALVVSLSALTLGAGLLGTTVGVINTVYYSAKVEAGDQLKVIAQGSGESLHNLVLALMILVLTALLTSVGAFRASRRPAAS